MKKVIIIQSILVIAIVATIEYFSVGSNVVVVDNVDTEETKSFFSITRVLLSVVIGFFSGAFMEGFFEAMFKLEKREYGSYISLIYFIIATSITYFLLWRYW